MSDAAPSGKHNTLLTPISVGIEQKLNCDREQNKILGVANTRKV